MKVVSVQELDLDVVEEVKSNESNEAKEKVFNQVKELFHLTSNKNEIGKNILKQMKSIEVKEKQLRTADKSLNGMMMKLKDENVTIQEKVNSSIDKLKSLIGDTNES